MVDSRGWALFLVLCSSCAAIFVPLTAAPNALFVHLSTQNCVLVSILFTPFFHHRCTTHTKSTLLLVAKVPGMWCLAVFVGFLEKFSRLVERRKGLVSCFLHFSRTKSCVPGGHSSEDGHLVCAYTLSCVYPLLLPCGDGCTHHS